MAGALELFLIAYAAQALFGAWLAHRKGYNFLLALLVTALLPAFGFLGVVLAPERPRQAE